jgi:nucleotide sugar dehydrogenase
LEESKTKKNKISIAGTGYVGLCTAVGFALKDYQVIASTHETEKVKLINEGIPPFHEPRLTEALRKVVKNGHLKCVLDLKKAIMETNVSFITTGTPSKADGRIDLRLVKKASKEIGLALKHKKSYHLVVVKSTVTPGVTQNIVKPIIEKHSKKLCGKDFGLCMNPEFLREGTALDDTLNPDRIVIGEYDKKSGNLLEKLYREFYRDQEVPILRMNLVTAELVKYASNAFLATRLSFINQIANICERISGADVKKVALGMGFDKRIGPYYLNAGLGYGGSCLPKDVKALISFCKEIGYVPHLIKVVEEVNNNQANRAIEFAENALGKLANKKIAILGLAFKPDTDDIREAVSLKIIKRLLDKKSKVVAYDPVAMENVKNAIGERIGYATSAIECIKDADCCIIVTEWNEFKKLKPKDFVENMRRPVIIDGRRLYDPIEFSSKTKYFAIGLGK